MSHSDIAIVLFDLDGTLCEYQRSTDTVLSTAFENSGVEPFFDTGDFRRWIPKVKGNSPLDLREQCFAAIAKEKGYNPNLGHKVAAAYEDRDPENVRFLPGANSVLDTLADRYRLGLITNGGCEKQQAKLNALGIAEVFETMVFATPETDIKPDPDPFYRALDALDGSVENTVHIGNSLESDVAGAQAAGITAVWIPDDPTDQPVDHTPEYTLESLHELEEPPWE
jgi:HAD superfamily hydrolase (TIGR01509 family)